MGDPESTFAPRLLSFIVLEVAACVAIFWSMGHLAWIPVDGTLAVVFGAAVVVLLRGTGDRLGCTLHRALYTVLAVTSALTVMMAFCPLYFAHGLRSTLQSRVVHDRWTAVYFSVVSMTTLGFGDFVPSDGATRVGAAAEAFVGYLLLGALLAVVVLQVGGAQRSSDA